MFADAKSDQTADSKQVQVKNEATKKDEDAQGAVGGSQPKADAADSLGKKMAKVEIKEEGQDATAGATGGDNAASAPEIITAPATVTTESASTPVITTGMTASASTRHIASPTVSNQTPPTTPSAAADKFAVRESVEDEVERLTEVLKQVKIKEAGDPFGQRDGHAGGRNAAAAASVAASPPGHKSETVVRFIRENYARGTPFTVQHVLDEIQRELLPVTEPTVNKAVRWLLERDSLRILNPAHYRLVVVRVPEFRMEIAAVPRRPRHIDVMLFICDCEDYMRGNIFTLYDVVGPHDNRRYDYDDVVDAMKVLTERRPKVISKVQPAGRPMQLSLTE